MEKSKSARHSWKHQKVYLKAILREIGGGGEGGAFWKKDFLLLHWEITNKSKSLLKTCKNLIYQMELHPSSDILQSTF